MKPVLTFILILVMNPVLSSQVLVFNTIVFQEKFSSAQECQNFHTNWKSCSPSSCRVERKINGATLVSAYEIIGMQKDLCSAKISHAPKKIKNGKKLSPVFECLFNKTQRTHLEKAHKLTLSGEKLKMEYTTCISSDQKKMIGLCYVRVSGEVFLDIQKMANFHGQCKKVAPKKI